MYPKVIPTYYYQIYYFYYNFIHIFNQIAVGLQIIREWIYSAYSRGR